MLLGIDEFDILVELDVAGLDLAILIHGKEQGLGIAIVRFQKDFFEIENDFGDILNDSFDGGELVHRTINLHGRDGRAFQ